MRRYTTDVVLFVIRHGRFESDLEATWPDSKEELEMVAVCNSGGKTQFLVIGSLAVCGNCTCFTCTTFYLLRLSGSAVQGCPAHCTVKSDTLDTLTVSSSLTVFDGFFAQAMSSLR
ncbi:uncharacterized protein PHALS_14987 [Plasmopara halstedii]|uniref:Uncharacterized protein n=1 Tax=Plasmopara halstedii TaxID=4781 RepID=A0A0N7L3V0_PLAHL|nr:uncharacterized protein PHALS_14987 [Plasmopara halstedii]CEG36891.1 hypothetical protein PHALS_14987 [Plasmopara halstedii]|eukprot:XP_024573260.1 hypothetical protein PHALS_14987 [Plasmopara halstedii]